MALQGKTYVEALQLTREAAHAQRLEVQTLRLDLGHYSTKLPAADLVIAADLLYDSALATHVAARSTQSIFVSHRPQLIDLDPNPNPNPSLNPSPNPSPSPSPNPNPNPDQVSHRPQLIDASNLLVGVYLLGGASSSVVAAF